MECCDLSEDEDFTKELQTLAKRIGDLERISREVASIDRFHDPESLSQILKRINAIQALVDQIEVEIDKLEMRVSGIEHMGFRIRTGGH